MSKSPHTKEPPPASSREVFLQRVTDGLAKAMVTVGEIVDGARRARESAGLFGRGANPRLKPAGPQELAFLAPIAVGSELAGATVTRIGAIREGLLHLDLRREADVYHLAVGLGRPGLNAPRAGRYAVYIWEQTPTPEASPLAEALAASLRQRPDREAPPGMTEGKIGAPR